MTWFYVLAAMAFLIPLGLFFKIRRLIEHVDRAEDDAPRRHAEPAE